MSDLILQALYFMLPAYVANMVPVFFSHWKMGRVMDSPVDLGQKFRGKRIFGTNKTVKGFLFGTVFGVLICVSQFGLSELGWTSGLNIINYTFYNSVLIGALLGFGALAGDVVESFLKRQIGIAPGRAFPVFDQMDFIVGSLVFVSIVVDLPFDILITILILSPVLPFIANIVAYFLKIKKVWW